MNRAITRFEGRALGLCLFCLLLNHCAPERRGEWRLLTPEFAAAWQAAGIQDEGSVKIHDGEIVLKPGQPMTGARFEAWETAQLPRNRYAIEYEAMRVEGNDFFATVTFPVDDSHVSLVVGGWGGTLVGLSSIDDMDASENNTTGNAYFENLHWHRVRIEVRDEEIKTWINGRLFVNVSTKGHKLDLRPGDIERCKPFGFATYATHARIRDVIVRRL